MEPQKTSSLDPPPGDAASLEACLSEMLEAYLLVNQAFTPPSSIGSKFAAWVAKPLFGNSESDQVVAALTSDLRQRTALSLILGPWYSGRVVPARRDEFFQQQEREAAQLRTELRSIKNKLSADVPVSREWLISRPLPLPPPAWITDEYGYEDAGSLKIALSQLESDLKQAQGRLRELQRRATECNQRVANLQRQYDSVRKDMGRAEASYESEKETRIAQQRALRNEFAEDEARLGNRHQREEEEEAERARHELLMRERAASETVAKAQGQKGATLRAMRFRRTHFVYLNFSPVFMKYLPPWLDEHLPRQQQRLGLRAVEWFAGCPLPGAVAMVSFVEEGSAGLDRSVREQSRLWQEAVKAASHGRHSSSVVVRLRPLVGSPLVPGEEEGVASSCLGERRLLAGLLQTTYRPGAEAHVALAPDRDGYRCAGDLRELIERVAAAVEETDR